MRYRAVVFDLLYTLVHPGGYPSHPGRVAWLADLLGLDVAVLADHWRRFEPLLEAGQAPAGRTAAPRTAPPDPPELAWICGVAEQLGVRVTPAAREAILADWDLVHRAVLESPPRESIQTLAALRERGLRLGLLSNTHGLEVRAWHRSPLAPMFDAVCFSHEIAVMKPHPESYEAVLRLLGVPAALAAFVGDGGSDELLGARRAGFGLIVFARGDAHTTASTRWAERATTLARQADATIMSLSQLAPLLACR